MKDKVLVSVLVPVYGVEKYIERCARSLFDQTMKDGIEFIFIDDCTPDNSIHILEEVLSQYPERSSQVKIIRHNINQGLVSARISGIKEASGEYIIHCDSDDWAEKDMYETLYREAKTNNSDIVVCDFFEGNDNNEVHRKQVVPASGTDRFKAIIQGNLHSAVWNKLISRKYIDKLGIIVDRDITMWEDLAYTTPYLISKCRISKVNRALYHYYCVDLSMSRVRSKKNVLSQIHAIKFLEKYLKSSVDNAQFDYELDLLKLKSKDYLLVTGDSFDPQLWRETYPELNNRLMKYQIPVIKKFLYFLCKNRIDFAVKFLAALRKH